MGTDPLKGGDNPLQYTHVFSLVPVIGRQRLVRTFLRPPTSTLSEPLGSIGSIYEEMTMDLQGIRARAFHAQKGFCFYCGFPMAMSDAVLQSFAKTHGLKRREARLLLATAEHLLARRDGGGDSTGNIVAAHHVCNKRRHQASRPKPPDAYRSYVQSRCRQGRWHSPSVLRLRPGP